MQQIVYKTLYRWASGTPGSRSAALADAGERRRQPLVRIGCAANDRRVSLPLSYDARWPRVPPRYRIRKTVEEMLPAYQAELTTLTLLIFFKLMRFSLLGMVEVPTQLQMHPKIRRCAKVFR